MAMTEALRNALLDQGRTNLTFFASLHTAAPGTTGLNEVSGGSYARVAVTYSAASGGQMQISSTATLNVPAGTTVTHVGLFSASTAGTFYASFDPADEAFGSDGTLDLTGFTLSLT